MTVVIPAHNEERDLGETLDALMRQTTAPERIIVVDDGSTDRTSEVAAQYPVEIVRNEKPLGNKARVVNYVAPEIDTDLIINLDADTILAPDYCELIKAPFADERVAVAAGIVLTWNPQGRVPAEQEHRVPVRAAPVPAAAGGMGVDHRLPRLRLRVPAGNRS